MNKVALFAIIASGMMMSSFHQPNRQAIADASKSQRTISSVIREHKEQKQQTELASKKIVEKIQAAK
jgi:predicted ABC-type ATPase